MMPVSPSCPHPPSPKPTFQQWLEIVWLQIPATGTWCGGTHKREEWEAKHATRRGLLPHQHQRGVNSSPVPPLLHTHRAGDREQQRCLKPLNGLGKVRRRLKLPIWGWALPPALSRDFPELPGMSWQARDAPQGCCWSMLPYQGGLSAAACLNGDDPTVRLCAKRPDTKTPPGPLIRTKRPRAGELHSSALSWTRGAMERLGQGQAQLQAVGKLGRMGKGAVQRPKW